MKKLLKMKNFSLLIGVLIVLSFTYSCEKDYPKMEVVTPFEPGAKFRTKEASYDFEMQHDRWLTLAILPFIRTKTESVILGYTVVYKGTSGRFDIHISKKFQLSELENDISALEKCCLFTSQSTIWDEYVPSENELAQIFSVGEKKVLRSGDYFTRLQNEGVMLTFNPNEYGYPEWTSYQNDTNKIPVYYEDEIEEFEITRVLASNNPENIKIDLINSDDNFLTDTTYSFIVEMSFRLPLYHKEITDTLIVESGKINAFVYL